MKHELSADEIRALPTIRQGHFGNLKYEDADTRIWVCRETGEIQTEVWVNHNFNEYAGYVCPDCGHREEEPESGWVRVKGGNDV